MATLLSEPAQVLGEMGLHPGQHNPKGHHRPRYIKARFSFKKLWKNIGLLLLYEFLYQMPLFSSHFLFFPSQGENRFGKKKVPILSSFEVCSLLAIIIYDLLYGILMEVVIVV